jgi:hypothetical protein
MFPAFAYLFIVYTSIFTPEQSILFYRILSLYLHLARLLEK